MELQKRINTICYICNMYINQRDAQILVNSLYFFVKWLYMFRTNDSPEHVGPFNEKIKTNDSPKHVGSFNEKIKTIHKNLCIPLVYTHIAIWCTVHTTSKCYICIYLPSPYSSSFTSSFLLHLFLRCLLCLSFSPIFYPYCFFFFSSGSFLPTLCLFSYQIFTYNVRVCTHKYTNTHTQNYSWMHVATSQFSPWLYSDALELQTYRHINAPPPKKKHVNRRTKRHKIFEVGFTINAPNDKRQST